MAGFGEEGGQIDAFDFCVLGGLLLLQLLFLLLFPSLPLVE